jgi:NADPH-dependent 2,4-dienoyl-CoA reductase/sulfur reductase-like enzyme
VSGDSRPLDTGFAVIGAGPAGMAAAVAAADAGCRVVVVDLGDRPGGQYWRHREGDESATSPTLQHKWAQFKRLQDRFFRHRRAGSITYLPGHAVWHVQGGEGTAGFEVRFLTDERRPGRGMCHARAIVLATGAFDRQVPFPGWTLPGVMTVGGVQSLLKGSGVRARQRAVVAGSGPFLLSVAESLLRSGAAVVAVVEANPVSRYLRRPMPVLGAPGKVAEAIGYLATLARHRVPYLVGRAVVTAHGSDHLEAVTIARVDAEWQLQLGTSLRAHGERRLECDTLAVGYGFVPQVELALTLGCATRVEDGVLVLEVDGKQETSVPGVFAAGETCGVGGADLALVEGRIAGLEGAAWLGSVEVAGGGGCDLERLRRQRSRLRDVAELLRSVHPVQEGWTSWCDGSTVVCRCEEVTKESIVEAVELGARDPRAVKLLSRAGMGPCQGRICGPAVASLTSQLTGVALRAGDLAAFASRPIAQPVPLGLLALEQGREIR